MRRLMKPVNFAMTLMALVFLAWPAMAADDGKPEAAWQAVITGQIEAFRAGDGDTALSLAGAGFQARFKDPAAFVAAIEASGYDAIVRSVSHSFGEFEQVDETHVVQIVRIVGPDQLIYEALYQLENEDGGWRVQGVALRRRQGVAI
ncbi:hypothetical protein GCM10011321_02320 [Youhaiella tibetensis]|uniref:DUF4864 domain-containing protein n=1 Tax=Paradevosia tibetensis TaxID=1447062 RepID=A0A5B9DRJ2_9HYPH|nr:DUF4864 domain-containing protein [Youhaiella tibetensis]QEE21555.1 DUF4864 domain-containing protein [Youhaiella tibetensis]GGF13915.1 hypothetical protein GCM10011321_02320 [Youhaiella tibetensis]